MSGCVSALTRASASSRTASVLEERFFCSRRRSWVGVGVGLGLGVASVLEERFFYSRRRS
eukprot:scaffold113433_cov51-Phaeocystis_antarctica.AAC.2